MFMNTAIDQQVDVFTTATREPSQEEYANIRAGAEKMSVERSRDILKEDQAQNTCIFSLDFALKMMGDIRQYFIENEMQTTRFH